MHVVLSHPQLTEFRGSETYTLTVAEQLQRLGHESTIYTPVLGPMAHFALSQGLHVVDRLGRLPSACDAVIAQDTSTVHELAGHYPEAVRVYVMHAAHHPRYSPPQLKGSYHALVVMNDRLLERAHHLGWHPEIVRLRQPIDSRRFRIQGVRGRNGRPPRVLLLRNIRDNPQNRMIREACRRAGVELAQVGGPVPPTPHPEHAIADAEMVISLGRGVLEAMAGGRAAYVLGPDTGGDGWVMPDNYPALESDGFTGAATDARIDLDRLSADLASWEESMGEQNRELVWTFHDGDRHAYQLIDLIKRLGPTADAPPGSQEELARLVRLEWYSFERAEGALVRVSQLQAEVDELRERLMKCAGHLDAAEARVEALRSTKRYRTAQLLASPLDWIRSKRP